MYEEREVNGLSALDIHQSEEEQGISDEEATIGELRSGEVITRDLFIK